MPPKRRPRPVPQTSSPIPISPADVPFELVSHSDGAWYEGPHPNLVERPLELACHASRNPPTAPLSPIMTNPLRPPSLVEASRSANASPARSAISSPAPNYSRSRCPLLTSSEMGPNCGEPYRDRSIGPAAPPFQCSCLACRLGSHSPHSECTIPRAPSRAPSPCSQRGRSPRARYATSSYSHSPSLGAPANQAVVHQLIEKPRHEAMRLVREFSTALSQELHGFPSPSPVKGLMPSIHAEYRKFAEKLYGTAPQFRPWKSTDRVDQSALIKKLTEDDDAVGLGSVSKLHLNEITELAQRYRMGELEDGYPKAVKPHLVQASTEKWKGIAEKCFTAVETAVLERVETLATEHFGVYSDLKTSVLQRVTSIISEVAEATHRLIDQILRCESSVYTLNEKDLKDHRTRFLRLYQDVHRQSLGQGSVTSALNNHTPSVRPSSSSDAQKWQHINNAIASLSALGISGVTAEALVRVIPPSESNAELEVMAEVRAYFEIAYKRFGDNVPNQINTSFIGGIKDGLDGALTSMVLDVADEDCRKWFE